MKKCHSKKSNYSSNGSYVTKQISIHCLKTAFLSLFGQVGANSQTIKSAFNAHNMCFETNYCLICIKG